MYKRQEPPVSVPIANVHNPALTAAAEPELEPPGTFSKSQGLRQVGVLVLIPKVPNANSTRFVLPIITDFCSMKSSVIFELDSAMFFSRIFDPAEVILPFTSTRSFNPIIIPVRISLLPLFM